MNNSYSIISDPDKINKSDWTDFVYTHAESNIFQTPEYFELCDSISLYNGIVICCLQEIGICGILVAVIQKDFSSIAGNLTARSVICGGPLTEGNNTEVAGLLLEEYDNMVRGKVLYSQFRNLSDNSHFSGIFKSNRYTYEEHLNILINLKNGKERLWSDIHPTRRKQINRSYRRDVAISVPSIIESDNLKKCYTLLERVYRKAGLPLPSLDFFINTVRIFSKTGILKLFIAEYRSEIIGFRLVLCYKETIYDWYAAGSDNHLDKYPNDVLPWEIFSWGRENGYSLFDFGGAGKPTESYGVRDYKLKFGGELVNFGRYTKVYKKLSYRIIMTLFHLRQKLINKKR